MIDLVKIALLGGTQGKSGALKFYPSEQLEETIANLEFIFIKINGSKVPFKVNKINQNNDPWLLHIDEIDSPEKAQIFTNADVFAESKKVGNIVEISEETMKGFQILSAEGESFGKVLDVEEHPKQILLVVEFKKQTFRIPFHPDLIEDLNKDEKTIVYTYSTEDLGMLFS